MTTQAIVTLVLAVLSLSLKPGPGMMMVMSRTISQGMGACLTFMLGCLIVTVCYLVIVFWGLHFADIDFVFVSILLKTLAALYLIWLGIKGLQGINEKIALQDVEGDGFFDNVTSAMILTASNPLVIVFYAGILPTLIDVRTISLDDMIVITTIVVLVEGIVPIIYCAPLAIFRRKMPDKFLRGLKLFSSIVIILVGLYIGASALPSKDVTSIF